MEEFQMDIHLSCPWCGGSEILVDHRTKATISVQCAKCRKWTCVNTLDKKS